MLSIFEFSAIQKTVDQLRRFLRVLCAVLTAKSRVKRIEGGLQIFQIETCGGLDHPKFFSSKNDLFAVGNDFG